MLNFLFCHEDRDVAADRGLPMVGTFTIHNAHLLFTREAYPTTAYQLLANLAPRAASSGSDSPGEQTRLPQGLCIGDPDWCIDQVKRWESIGTDGINFLLNANEVLRQDEVLSSLRLFATEVMPKFSSREAAHA
jgi:alkanesulfonate monooxygenase SsuD/methylene tetrahydromethanopterin reductase-like flavin-dependent oxidoreductase (luciferase family)